jgi:hypothetical protein
MAYAAKKQGEIAPGVGKETDMFMVTRAGWEAIMPPAKQAVSNIYTDFEARGRALIEEQLSELREALRTTTPQQQDQQQQPRPATTSEPSSPKAPESSGNESGDVLNRPESL